jgi:hypothetical protein
MTMTPTTTEAAPTVAEILAELMAYEREAFEEDTCLDLADLCTWFGGMRGKIKAALTAEAAQLPLAVIRGALKAGLGYLEEMQEDQTSGEDDGIYEPGPDIHARHDTDEALISLALGAVDGVTPGAVLVPAHLVSEMLGALAFVADADGAPSEAAIERLRSGLEAAAGGELKQRTIGIRIEGGLFAGAFSPAPMPDVKVTVFDFDDDCLEPDRAFKVEGEDRWASISTYEGAEFDVRPIPAFEPVEEGEGA